MFDCFELHEVDAKTLFEKQAKSAKNPEIYWEKAPQLIDAFFCRDGYPIYTSELLCDEEEEKQQ